MSWEVAPEPLDPHERAVLLQAAMQALEDEPESAWWRSGLDDLGGGAAPKQAWGRAGVVDP